MKRRYMTVSALVLSVAVLVSGCGANKDNGTSTSETVAVTSSSETENAEDAVETAEAEETEATDETEDAEDTESTADAEETAAGETSITTDAIELVNNTIFGNADAQIEIDDFNALGFDYGDSVDIIFSNGYTMIDTPYYNGYYTRVGDTFLTAYPGDDHLSIGFQSGPDTWETVGLQEGDTVVFSLNTKAKYLDVQEALSLVYSNERSDFASDEVFANFRACNVGNLKENILYRSASPVDNHYNRAATVSTLVQETNIATILDISNDEDRLQSHYEKGEVDLEYHKEMLASGHVIPCRLSVSFPEDDYKQSLAEGLRQMMALEGPYLIHCTEGKDRTGFVLALLEGLCGASCEEISNDYMITYDNYYGVTEESDKNKYDMIATSKLEDILLCVGDGQLGDDVSTLDYNAGARKYLQSAGMTDEEIDALIEVLTK